MKIIDISMKVSHETPVYPGDTPFTLKWLTEGRIKTSEICVTPHVGTHVDVPMHFSKGALPVCDYPLEIFVGECFVVTPDPSCDEVGLPQVPADIVGCPRVLFKFREGQSLSVPFMRRLAENGLRLLGTNQDSVDLPDSEEFPIHNLGLSKGVCFVENLVLDTVRDGKYFLSAAPIKWSEAEASPVRAYLIDGIL